MNPAAFERTVFEAARRAGGRVAGIVEPGATPNFIAARVGSGPAHGYVRWDRA